VAVQLDSHEQNALRKILPTRERGKRGGEGGLKRAKEAPFLVEARGR